MTQEIESSTGFLSKDLSDSANRKGEIDDVVESEFRLKDIILTSNIKLVFLACIVLGFVFSIYYGAITALLAFGFAGVFMLDMMGVFDSFKDSRKKMSKPGGYENIE
jgi:hypothetical protein